MFKTGDAVYYRSRAGDRYRANIVACLPGGVYHIAVSIPGCREPYELRSVNAAWLEHIPAYSAPFTTDVP